jgi:hypothetical protein
MFFQVRHFWRMWKSHMEQHTQALNKTLLNNHICYSLIPSRKWLSRL